MITFVISLLLLILGYFVYSRIVEKIFGPDERTTPAIAKADGVDYMVLPSWKVFMIQFLNIAGTGPIFGAIMGIWYGPAAYLWIVFGCIFAGATHDYLMGMLSLRHDGTNVPELVGTYLGPNIKKVVMAFSVVLLVMVGAVFVLNPAALLTTLCHDNAIFNNLLLWIIIIFAYYVIATMMPIDKIIGKVYPIFAFALIFMAIGLMIMLFVYHPQLPEIWDGLGNMGEKRLGIKNPDPIFPALFITIACGAISGFHATQTPLMARCVKSEFMGRRLFYGPMITEGVVALVWATVSSYFFFADGWREVLMATAPDQLERVEAQLAEGTGITQVFGNAAEVVMIMCNSWLGIVGGILAVLGVVAAPITSGDTAFRSARLIVAEALNISQRPILKRLMVCLPLFAVAIALLVWQMENKDGFNVIWKYFGWSNQTLSVFTLWTITAYLTMHKRNYWITLIPAAFMTSVCTSFLVCSNQALGLGATIGYITAVIAFVASFLLFYLYKNKLNKK